MLRPFTRRVSGTSPERLVLLEDWLMSTGYTRTTSEGKGSEELPAEEHIDARSRQGTQQMKRLELTARDVRSATLADVSTLEPLIRFAYRGGKEKVSWTNEHQLVKGPRISESELKEVIASSDKTILVAEQTIDGRKTLLGCILVEQQADEAYIGMLAVDPDRQSGGIGKLLLESAEMHAVGVFGCSTAKMWIINGRDELLAWYKRMGYEETGETEPFLPPESGVIPLVDNLHFLVIRKDLD